VTFSDSSMTPPLVTGRVRGTGNTSPNFSTEVRHTQTCADMHPPTTYLIGLSTGNRVRSERQEISNALIQVKTNFLKVSSLCEDKTAHLRAIIDGYTLQYRRGLGD